MPVSVKTSQQSPRRRRALVRTRRALYRRRHAGDARGQRGRSVVFDHRAGDGPRLDANRASGARITIGAGVTLAQILRERDLAFLHPVARSIGGPAVRNMGTVGGNLFAPAPFGDLAVALLALDATVSIQGGYGAREMAIEEFLAGRDRPRVRS